MAASTYDEALRRLLVHEGGYTNHPADPGGPTNFGITIDDYRKYVKPNATAADVRAMKLEEAKAIYRRRYWDAQRCDELPAGVDYSVFDYGVNSGIGRSGKVLRRVVGLPDNTSAVTDQVLYAVAGGIRRRLSSRSTTSGLRSSKPGTWPVFGRGWATRVAEVKAVSPPAWPIKRCRSGAIHRDRCRRTAAPAKGVVPPPAAIKERRHAGARAGRRCGRRILGWVVAHPCETARIALCGVVCVGGSLYALNRWHQRRQEAATPEASSPYSPA